ncbi:MAG: hypothetical protein KJ676_10235 [Alphaproteobacteria bacterium]|nr:hypothetical protein [Alphaproteobacteria bacterium]MBU1527083.1 hypothetical protein [Alphaproteobacteria bacterium]MBU2349991.1 hypothetical protein [Alphaproteobacteria bacterium]MBU2382952.1 hypothetical protein [Alphaproteobacteria bacterium]
MLVDVGVDPELIDNYAWRVCNIDLQRLEAALKDFHGVSGPAVRTRFQSVNEITLGDHYSNVKLRVIVYTGDPPVLNTEPGGPILIGVQIGGRPGWRSAKKPFTAIVGCERDQFPNWLTDLLLDIYIANSSCIKPLVDAVALNGLSKFFAAKVSYAIANGGSSRATPIAPDSGYIALSSLRSESDLSAWRPNTSAKHAEIALRIWDRFLSSSCSDFYESMDDAAENLLKRNKIGPLISPSVVHRDIIPGICVMAVFTPKLRQTRDLASEAASVFRFSAPRRNSAKFLPADFLWSNAKVGTYERRKRLISEGRIRLERYYAKS